MKHLSDLLGHNHPLFAFNINQLERAAGYPGIDTRLLAHCTEAAHDVMRKLRLDSAAGVQAHELHKALIACVRDGRGEELLGETDYVLLRTNDGTVSFNLHDIIEDSSQNRDFADRSLDHARRHLRMEIIKRYADHDRTDDAIVQRLADEAGLRPKSDLDYYADTKKEGERVQQNSNTPSILAIGDIFTDAFIKLGDETARIFKDDDGAEWLAVPYGRKPPYERVDIVKSVGPSPNAAVSCQKFGLNASLMAWVGDDETGEEAIEYLNSVGVGTEDMVVEPGNITSYWYVLSYKADRTMLIKSEKYKYEFTPPKQTPDWIYLSYTGEDSWPLHEKLADYLDEHPDIKLAFQPGTYHFNWGAEKLARIYKRSYIAIMNREEAMDVTGEGYDDLHKLANSLHALGPEIVVITDGPNGSYASYDGKLVTIPNYPDSGPPLDRTGAGDAFASTIVSALALGESMETGLLWAPINSMNVVMGMGAQVGLQTRPQIEEWLEKAPEDYKVREL